jgi:hypothetical protein
VAGSIGYKGYTVGAEQERGPRGISVLIPFEEGVPLFTLDLSRIIPGSAVYTGRVTVPIAGSRVQLPDLPCRSVTIRALATNAGDIYFGNELVDSGRGFPLAAGDCLDLAIDNLRRLYIDAANNGDGIAYLVVN